jgi:acetate kinase
MKILVINAGSSSLKYQLIDMQNEQVLCKGVCEKITQDGSFLNHKKGDQKYIKEIAMPTHKEALSAVLDILCDKTWGVVDSLSEIDAVGHRVLHGGEDFKASSFVDEEALRLCNKNKPLGPLHMPANILCMEIMRDLLGKPQVAVFDTSFHQTMPDYAYRYAIPKQDYTELKLRRYGFHGTSHKFVTAEAEEILGKSSYKLITCHLGNGASVAAIKDGKVMDTSMGFTPLEGLVMGTRSGDLDPAVLEVIMNNRDIKDVGELVNVYLNKKSGMKGICGKGDMREVQAAAEAGDDDARLAFDMFVYRVKKYIGAYAATLNGVDCIVMTGGIGENSYETRERILTDMEYLGVKLDKEANAKARGVKTLISTPDSKVAVWVIPTNEELVIARDTMQIVNARK